MKDIFFAVALLSTLCLLGCGQDTLVADPDATYAEPEQVLEAYGSIGGYVRNVPDFNVASADVLVINSYEPHVDIFVQAPDEDGTLVWVMARVATINDESLFDVAPGTYDSENGLVNADTIFGMGCVGYERGHWYFDSMAQEAKVVITDTNQYRVMEYEYHFRDAYNNEAYLSGFINLPYPQ